MNDRTPLPQAVRGPVMLITIGVLFALQQARILSFGKSWPLILIVLGVMKLMERAGPPAPPPPYTGVPPYTGAQPPGGQAYPGAPPYTQPPYPPPPPPYTPPPPPYNPPPPYTPPPPGGPRR